MGDTALMNASCKGHLKVVRTLLESKADVNAKNKVRNQMMTMMMMMMMMMILLTILMMIMMMVINDEDKDDCR